MFKRGDVASFSELHSNQEAILNYVRSRLEFTDPKTGTEVEVRGLTLNSKTLQMRIYLKKDGKSVGSADRTIYVNDDGELAVEHGFLKINRALRGQGIATRFNDRLERFYRANDVKQITLEANLDVGGYAWAKAGYDFATIEDAWRVARLFRQRLGRGTLTPRRPAQILVDRAAAAKTLEQMPTPLEFAMLGWEPGQEMWPGKEVMLVSTWSGVKRLDP
jgi:hypothetical protein